MGALGAQAISEAVDEGLISLRRALSWHLNSNHYPALPDVLVGVCEEAVIIATAAQWDTELWDTEIDLPEGLSFRGSETATVSEIVDTCHLDGFIDWEGEG